MLDVKVLHIFGAVRLSLFSATNGASRELTPAVRERHLALDREVPDLHFRDVRRGHCGGVQHHVFGLDDCLER